MTTIMFTKGAKSGSNTYTVRGVSKDGKKFTTMFKQPV